MTVKVIKQAFASPVVTVGDVVEFKGGDTCFITTVPGDVGRLKYGLASFTHNSFMPVDRAHDGRIDVEESYRKVIGILAINAGFDD